MVVVVDEGLAMDSPDDIFVAQLLARARRFGLAVVAIDVRASSGSYEPEFGRMRARLVVRAVLATAAPRLSTLDCMVAVQHAFKIDLEQLREVSAFAAGSIDGPALDAALAGRIQQTRPQWSMPHALLDAYTDGPSR